jgi:DNA-binding LacI/PurR family transcriptional regulator
MPAGSRLMSRRDLLGKFHTSMTTVQSAVDELVGSGFLTSRPGDGTYVVDNPPHLTRYAIVFPHEPAMESNTGGLFQRAVYREAMRFIPTSTRRLEVFSGMHDDPDGGKARALSTAVENHEFAGLIFSTRPSLHMGTPAITHPGVPRVALSSTIAKAAIGYVSPDWEGFYTRAASELKSRGCKRVAVISTNPGAIADHRVETTLRRRGIETRPYWLQYHAAPLPQGVRNCVWLLLSARGKDRPDGLIVDNDHFAQDLLQGLSAAGATPGRDVHVVCHWNFSDAPPSPGIRWLGFDSAMLIEKCVECLEGMREGSVPQDVQVTVPAVTEEEWRAARERAREAAGMSIE